MSYKKIILLMILMMFSINAVVLLVFQVALWEFPSLFQLYGAIRMFIAEIVLGSLVMCLIKFFNDREKDSTNLSSSQKRLLKALKENKIDYTITENGTVKITDEAIEKLILTCGEK